MKSETKTHSADSISSPQASCVQACQNCKNDFVIEPDDFGFYEKIGVPPPTFCSECRLQRRLAWRNDLSFYKRNCDLCDKSIISLYHPDKNLVVYCNRCWWSDKWDPKLFGQDVDFSRPFFEQCRELQNKVPLLSLFNDNGVGSVNCEYTQNTTFAKNCYMGSMSWYSEDVMYYFVVAGPGTKDVMDSMDLFKYSEIIYDSIFLENSYNCRNCYSSTGLSDCTFCYDCKGCSDCFMCVNLRQKKYCILNKQYTKEEYEIRMKEYDLGSYKGYEKAKKEFSKFLPKQVRRYANIRNSVNCTGDSLFNCKNTKDSFFARGCENMRFLWRGNNIKDSYDLTPAGESSLCYEGLTPDHDSQVLFSIYSLKSQELSYVENCHSSKNLFGCFGIRSGKYCILNKEYSKQDYFALKEKLIKHMKETGEYGEFFPANLSHFGYNETTAHEYFPLSKTEALEKGFKWWDDLQKTTGKETLDSKNIPDHILDVSTTIIEEILACVECERNYKIVPNEYNFYKKHNIPIPRKCFYCRNRSRLKFENPFKLWHRSCMCGSASSPQSTTIHDHKGHCTNEFETSYAPDRPEQVYCEACYQKEVY